VLWKYSFDLGEWKMIKCQNVPQKILSCRVILSGNIIIIYRTIEDPSGEICSDKMFLGKILMTTYINDKYISKIIT